MGLTCFYSFYNDLNPCAFILFENNYVNAQITQYTYGI